MANRIDIGDRVLAYRRWGEGFPVVFVSALGTSGSDWAATVYEMQEPVDALTYQRSGIGSSDYAREPGPQGYRAGANELDALATALDFPRPFILVGHSHGGLISRVYAADHPGSVAGLVLVECSFDDMAGPFGERRVVIDGEARGRTVDGQLGATELQAAVMPSVPAAVVTALPDFAYEGVNHSEEDNRAWSANQARLASELGAKHYVSAEGGHLMTEDDPALIAHVIDEVIRQVR
jgi:pimeloyl-ACP methyl ester carboxylesterase